MSTGDRNPSLGSSAARQAELILCRLDGPGKVYVARGVSIGRTADNTFAIDDPRLSRHHAQFEEDGVGGLMLRCLDQAAVLILPDGRQVRELRPAPGVRFYAGPAEFEFQAAAAQPSPAKPAGWLRKCPRCGSPDLPGPRPTPQTCPSCGHRLIVFQTAQAGVACISAVNLLTDPTRATSMPVRSESVELVCVAAEGGMGVVFEGLLQPSGRRVAVKLLHSHLAGDESMARRFEKELETLRGINHPHVVRLIGHGRWDELTALVTEWMPGGSLKILLERQPAAGWLLPWFVAAPLFRQACLAVAAVHRAGLVHRDVKPSNFLLGEDGRLKIADLGLATAPSGQGELTATGLVFGSPKYMAPEQWLGQPEQRSDLFSLGVMFYELLTGRAPQGAWQPASRLNPTVPAGVDRLLERLLAPDPSGRFGSAEEVLAELDGHVPAGLVVAQAPGREGWAARLRQAWTRSEARTKVMVASFAAVVLVVTVGLLLGWAVRRAPAPPRARVLPWSDHAGPVSSVAFSPDGTKVLTGSYDTTAKLWDAASSNQLWTFQGHTDRVASVAFSPDGTKVLTGSYDTTARLWDAATGKEILTFRGHNLAVWSVAFSPDGRKVLTGSGDNTARLWDAASGKEILAFQGHTDRVASVAFSRDGTKVLTGSWDKTARLWDAATGKEILTFQGHTLAVWSVAFSPDGTKVLTGSWDATARLWDAASGNPLRTFHGHTAGVWSVGFSPDGTKVLTGSFDKTARLWDAATGNQLQTFLGHTAEVASVAFSHDGTNVLTGSGDTTARLWDAATGKQMRTFQGHTVWVSSAAFSPDGTKVLTGSGDKTARLWDAATGKKIRTFLGHTDWVSSVAFSPDGTKVLTGSWDKTANLWDAATGEEIRTFQGHTLLVSSVAFSPDGTKVLTGSGDTTARLWDVATGEEIRTFRGHTDGVSSVAFSPDGTKVLIGSWDTTASLWDAATGEEIRTFQGHTDWVSSVAFSPDGTKVLTGSGDKTARLWDAVTGKQIRTFQGHADWVRSVRFSPDGTKVLTGSFDKTARLWDVATGNPLRTFEGHTDRVASVAFSPDGRKVLTGSWGGSSRLWDAGTGQELAQLWRFRSGGWLAITPQGYYDYDGSTDTLNLVRLEEPRTGRELSLEEVKAYHRPDLVRKRLAGEL